ncbi:MAG: LLM class flavin-dependent oxidoreductase [Deltaproteobacteria bacterium]|nr:LLM class flavin-dependent oxidoreductase [Deltaproteobacteria bacterium]
MNEDAVAIIGLACRFPGAPDRRRFWRLLESRKSAVREVPAERWDIDALYDPTPGTPGKMVTRFGGFIDGVDEIDPQFFGISPREAETMDPQQRIVLEATYEALQDAGIPFSGLRGQSAGVFMGFQVGDYFNLLTRAGAELDPYVATGNSPAIISNRVSYLLDARGPSVSIDTACSSALVAVHLATRSLRSGESSLALAGAVNLILSPDKTIALSQARMMAPDGRCKAFDARADGYVRSEGAGVVVLKRLGDALKDRDPIWAVIRGTAVNQDGRTNGLTAPNGPAQEAVIRGALADAKVEGSQISYVEAHGTGTPLGDPIEIQALGSVLCRDRREPLRVGSVKTNIGHLESAAGIAGLIKVVLSMHEGVIPGSLHLETPNPNLGLSELPIELPSFSVPWPRTARPRIAGVSSFGFGGTNAHVILEEAPAQGAAPAGVERGAHVVALSGRTPELVREEAAGLAAWIAEEPWNDAGDFAYSRNVGREPQLHRVAVVGRSLEELEGRLRDAATGATMSEILVGQRRRKPPKLGFLFTGQGAQAHGMGRALFECEPSFRRDLERCAAIAGSGLDKPLLDLLYGREADPDLQRTSNAQIALFALEYALAEWWRTLGVAPDVVLGHSLGEIVAAVIAECLPLEEAIQLVLVRGRLMAECGGKMAAVFAPLEVVAEAIGADRREVEISAINELEHAVISGSAAGVDRVVRRLEAAGRVVRPLKVSGAFHSPEMDPVLERFRQALAPVAFAAPKRAWVSNLTGQLRAQAPDADYWVRHVRRPVQFLAGIRTAKELGATVFLEVGPSAVLSSLGRRALADAPITWIASLAPSDEWGALARAAAGLWTQGIELDWERFDRAHGRSKLRLPPLPYERRRFWFTPGTDSAARSARTLRDQVAVQAKERPGAIAVVSLEGSLSYTDLASRIATREAELDSASAYDLDASRSPSADLVIEILALLGKLPAPGALSATTRALLERVEASLPSFLQAMRRAHPRGEGELRTWIAPKALDGASGILELLYPLSSGDTLVFRAAAELPPEATERPDRALGLSLLFLAQEDGVDDAYRMMLEGARFADAHGFSAVWIQEQHFHAAGGPYPNPALAAAAVAAVTKRISVRGNIRLPLHHPVRVAEEWAMVDRLSSGRVALAFSSSVDPGDYVFGQAAYAERNEVLLKNLDVVRALWRGEPLAVESERPLEIRTYPRPKQRELPVWLNAGCEDIRYHEAAEHGAHVIIPLAAMRFDELVRRIELYRTAWRAAGHPGDGQVTVMTHAFVGEDVDRVRETVRGPLIRQLKTTAGRLAAVSDNPDVKSVSEGQIEEFARLAFDQYFQKSGLFGTPASVQEKIAALRKVGVDELALIADFGLEPAELRTSLAHLGRLLAASGPPRSEGSDPLRGVASVWLFGEDDGALSARYPELRFTRVARPAMSTERVRATVAGSSSEARPRVERETYVAPKSETERLLVELWSAALRLPKVGVHDNFFELGGDSRLAIEIISKARAAGLQLDALQFFERPTIAEIAGYLATLKVVAGAAP